jgi:DNA-binding response OmpR family regulator
MRLSKATTQRAPIGRSAWCHRLNGGRNMQLSGLQTGDPHMIAQTAKTGLSHLFWIRTMNQPIIAKQYGVLIVEDDRATRTLIKRTLTKIGMLVREAELASQGFKAVDADIHLALVDIGLPDYDGIDLAYRLRRRFDKQRLKICFISSSKYKNDIMNSINAGGDDYIVKPIDTDLLAQKVTSLLGKAPDKFAWAGAKCPAELLETQIMPDLEILRISETGILLRSSARFKENSHLKLACQKMSAAIELPFEEIIHRVSSCVGVSGEYFVSTEFVGLSEQFAQPIRSLAIRGIFVN